MHTNVSSIANCFKPHITGTLLARFFESFSRLWGMLVSNFGHFIIIIAQTRNCLTYMLAWLPSDASSMKTFGQLDMIEARVTHHILDTSDTWTMAREFQGLPVIRL